MEGHHTAHRARRFLHDPITRQRRRRNCGDRLSAAPKRLLAPISPLWTRANIRAGVSKSCPLKAFPSARRVFRTFSTMGRMEDGSSVRLPAPYFAAANATASSTFAASLSPRHRVHRRRDPATHTALRKLSRRMRKASPWMPPSPRCARNSSARLPSAYRNENCDIWARCVLRLILT